MLFDTGRTHRRLMCNVCYTMAKALYIPITEKCAQATERMLQLPNAKDALICLSSRSMVELISRQWIVNSRMFKVMFDDSIL